MEKINFQDYPNTDTPVTANNLNTLQNNIEASFKNENSNSQVDSYCCEYINNLADTDTGWVDMSSYFNDNNNCYAIRTGYEPKVRRIGNKVYWKGEIYCCGLIDPSTLNLFSNIPEQFRPLDQFSSCGVTYMENNPYNILINSDGNINLSGEYLGVISRDSDTQQILDSRGFQLTNISGYLVD